MNNSPSQQQRIDALDEELKQLLDHPQAVDIAMSQWLFDPELPKPSLDLIQFIGFRMLTGEGIKKFAYGRSEQEVLEKAFEEMRAESEDERIANIQRVLDQLEAEKFLDAGRRINPDQHPKHEWWATLESFLFPDPDSSPEMQLGERAIARKVLESLFLRALFNLDVPRLKALVKTLEMISDGELPELSNAQKIAGAILQDRHNLTKALGRQPSKTEIQEFLLGVMPNLPDHPNAWADAWKMVSRQSEEPTTRNSDKDAIVRFIAQVNSSQADS